MKSNKSEMQKFEFVVPRAPVAFDPLKVISDDGVFSEVDAGARFPEAVCTFVGKCNNCGAKARALARIAVSAFGNVEHSTACAECTYDLLMGCVVVGGQITVATKSAGRAELVLPKTERDRVRTEAQQTVRVQIVRGR